MAVGEEGRFEGVVLSAHVVKFAVELAFFLMPSPRSLPNVFCGGAPRARMVIDNVSIAFDNVSYVNSAMCRLLVHFSFCTSKKRVHLRESVTTFSLCRREF